MSNVDDWKLHFAKQSAEWWHKYREDQEQSEPTVEVEINIGEEPGEEQPEDLPFYISGIKRKDISVLLYVRETLRRQIHAADEKRRAKHIKQVDKSIYLIQPCSIVSYIRQALLTSESPLHINHIIERIETLGWKSSSVYHKYSQVHKALRTNSYMFCRVGKASFKLCVAFSGHLPTTEARQAHRKSLGPKLTTFKDVVVNIAKEYQKTNNGSYPGQIHYVMMCMGFSCSYSTVYRAMQSEEFVRDGYWYSLRNVG